MSATSPSSRASGPDVRAAARPRLSLGLQHDAAAGPLPVARAQVRRWAAAALERDARLLIRFVGLAEGRRLNGQFGRHDHATNVLTFAYETVPVVQADIVICLPVLASEARAARLALRDHLAHLVVHGVLHAQGYDHIDDADAHRMEAREAQILRRFRIADPYRG